MKRKEKEIEKRKRDVFKIAKKLFMKEGYEKATMDKISEISEISKSTLYTYFRNKEDLFLAAYIQGQEKRFEILSEIYNIDISEIEKLKLIGNSFLKFYKKNPFYLELQLYWDYKNFNPDQMTPAIRDRFSELNLKSWNIINTIFEKGVEEKLIQIDLDISITATQFIYLLRSIIKQSINSTHELLKFESLTYFNNFMNIFFKSIIN